MTGPRPSHVRRQWCFLERLAVGFCVLAVGFSTLYPLPSTLYPLPSTLYLVPSYVRLLSNFTRLFFFFVRTFCTLIAAHSTEHTEHKQGESNVDHLGGNRRLHYGTICIRDGRCHRRKLEGQISRLPP
eukprot:COSAG02_NODE_42_length_46522_cov_109.704478_9_plen_128_part_00